VEPEISVIVPHYNDLASLDRCLAALRRQTVAPDRFEIVVADNGSPDGREAVDAVIAGRARLVIAAERGAGPARNAGVAASRGALLAFTDCDCIPAPNWLAAGLAKMADGNVVGGSMTVSVVNPAAMSGAEAFEAIFAFDNRAYVERKGFTVTANLFCSRATFDAVGPFRSGVSEDLEWCGRARDKGFRVVFADQAVVAHPARPDWVQLKRKWQRINAESFGLVASSLSGRVGWIGRSLLMPLSVVPHSLRVVTSAALPDTATRLRALGTLARLRWWRMANGIALALGKGR
jgi:glycosyltransferase involved in cell wall biosynthesis